MKINTGKSKTFQKKNLALNNCQIIGFKIQGKFYSDFPTLIYPKIQKIICNCLGTKRGACRLTAMEMKQNLLQNADN